MQRVVFTEITPRAIKEAISQPRAIASDLVDAQQARRALDYLVGFNLSPVLWRKVQRGLSAGRVQSPALRMIVEREEEIEAFIAREYWSIAAECAHPSQHFNAKLIKLDGQKFEQFTITDGDTAEAARLRIQQAAQGSLHVTDVASKERKRRPAPPFTTSTLQQEASRKLGFTTRKTMQVAQKLYEGVAIGDEGTVGLISYMRTDSVNLSQDALAEIRDVIARDYGIASLPDQPNTYQTKSKNAQEAHEAVRPTSALRTPAQVARFLTDDERRLYELIWKRAVACQMIPATLNTVSVDLSAGSEHVFRASGTTVVVPGFLAVYEEGKDSKSAEDEDEGRKLPAMKPGDRVPLERIQADQHFTQPPPRYTEAALVKALEEYGIGRPSTYASIIQTLLFRKYVEMEGRSFRPSDVGRAVSKFLSSHFTQYVDYDFTAKLEDELDAVSRGEEEWMPLMERFWEPFKELVEDKKESVDRAEASGARELGTDPKTGKPVSVRIGRFGPMPPSAAPPRTRRSRSSPRCAPASRCTPSPGRRAGTVPDAARAGRGQRRAGQRRHRPLRPVRQARQHLCLAEEGRRPVHHRPGPRRVPDRREGRDRAQPDHQGVRGQRHPGAERPLRPVHQRRQDERQDPQGSRAGLADPGRSAAADGRNRQAGAQGLRRQEGRREEGPAKKAAVKKEAAPKKAAAKKAPAKKAAKKAVKKAAAKKAPAKKAVKKAAK
jgi:DNA topoisomerase-1